jgi:hypothetical protein
MPPMPGERVLLSDDDLLSTVGAIFFLDHASSIRVT